MKLLVSAVALLVLASQGERVTLKHQPKEGDKVALTQKMSMKVNATVTAGGQKQEIAFEQKGSEKKSMEVKKVEGGKATQIFYNVEEDIEEKKEPGAEEFTKVEKPLHGRKVTVTLKDGKLVHEGGDGLDEKSLKSVDLEDEFSKAFPAKPVAVGESWEVGADVVKEMFKDSKLDGKINLKLAEVKDFEGRRSAFLEAQIEMKGGGEAGMQVNVLLKGTIVVWIERGYTLQVKMAGDVTMGAKNEQFEMSGKGPMKIEVNTTVK